MDCIKIIEKIKTFIKVPYYYVPPCPCCHGFVTGRYVLSHNEKDDIWVTTEALKHGEIVEAVPEIPENNAFCLECDFEWKQKVKTSWFSLSQIRHEKMVRFTHEILREKEEEAFREEEQMILEKMRRKRRRKLF